MESVVDEGSVIATTCYSIINAHAWMRQIAFFLMSTLIGLRLFTRSNPKKHLVAQSSYVIFVRFGITTTKSRIGTSSKNGSSILNRSPLRLDYLKDRIERGT